MSDINTMNDYSEFHWTYGAFIEACNIELPSYEQEYFDALDKIISEIQLHSLPFIAWLSTDGDVLSQWRAYSGDGTGLAIGFDAALVEKLAVRRARVTYDRGEQIEFMRNVIRAAFPFWKMSPSNDSARQEFLEFVFVQAHDMCLIKNPAFREEQEVRLLRATEVARETGQWTLNDAGGSGKDTVSSEILPIQYRSRNGGIVSYIDLPIDGLGDQVVKEVVIGPKSPNSGVEVEMALTSGGFKNFKIRHSTATYR